jgi:hypothetical protein
MGNPCEHVNEVGNILVDLEPASSKGGLSSMNLVM